MTHLVKAESKGLFKTTVPARPNQETGDDMRGAFPGARREAPFAVATAQTPDEARQVNMANWPEYDWPSVENLPPRIRGKHY